MVFQALVNSGGQTRQVREHDQWKKRFQQGRGERWSKSRNILLFSNEGK